MKSIFRPRLLARTVCLCAFVVACSSNGKVDAPAPDSGQQGGVWYETALDTDTAYLPMGGEPVAVTKDLAVPYAGQAFAADAYVPKGARKAPLVLVLPGALVGKDRYYWLGESLA